MLDPELVEMMTAKVYWAPCLGKTSHGDGQFPRPTQYVKARVEPRVEFVRTGSEGEDINSTLQVLTTEKLPEGCMVWLPGANLNVREQGRVVKSVNTMYDEDGSLSHYEVLV